MQIYTLFVRSPVVFKQTFTRRKAFVSQPEDVSTITVQPLQDKHKYKIVRLTSGCLKVTVQLPCELQKSQRNRTENMHVEKPACNICGIANLHGSLAESAQGPVICQKMFPYGCCKTDLKQALIVNNLQKSECFYM